uniref:Kinesin family member 13B n=1 Tax=Zosterops lateralis melanops TaxID=1220523 RepID=A0A8D2PDT0_ZOSLA
MGDSKVKVAVRVRPMNRRELDLHTKCVVDVDANKVILHPVNTNLSKGDASFSPLWEKPSLGDGEKQINPPF